MLRRQYTWFVGLILKDLRLLVSGASTLLVVMLFGLLMLAILGFSLDLDKEESRVMSVSLLWVVFWFTGEVLMQQSFQHERDGGAYLPILAALRSPGIFFWSKVVTNLASLAFIHAIIVELYTVMFGIHWEDRFRTFGIIWLAAMPGYVVVGTLVSCLTLELRNRALLYPILLFPLMLAVFMLAARATLLSMQGYARMFVTQPLEWLVIATLMNGLLALWVAPQILQPGIISQPDRKNPQNSSSEFEE